jgi:uncharacterized protein YjdB
LVALLAALAIDACIDMPVAPDENPEGATPCVLDDAYEENDSPDRAAPMGFGVIQAVRCRLLGDPGTGDDDFYSYAGEAGRSHRAVLSSDRASSRALRLFNAADGDTVPIAVDGNFTMPASGKLLLMPTVCCVAPGDSLGYSLSLLSQANRAPVPHFGVAPARPVVGRAAVLTSTSTDPDGDALAPALWRLGDGRTSTGSPATVAWAARGTYTIVLIVTDVLGRADSLAQTVEVDPDVSSIAVAPAQPELSAIGDTLLLTATARDAAGAAVSDIAFTWTSSDSLVAAVTTSGAVIARGNGTTTVNATAYGKSGSATVTVRQRAARLSINVSSLRFHTLGRTAALTAGVADARGTPMAGAGVSWRSADATIVSVDATGLVTALRAGTTTVSATLDALSADVLVTVVPVAASVAVAPAAATLTALADSARFVATVRDSAGYVLTSGPVAWTSSEPAVATVDAAGLVRPAANGTATITARAGAASADALVTVSLVSSIAVVPGQPVLTALGDTLSLTATARDAAGAAVGGITFSWSSSDSTVARVTPLGAVIARRNGTTTVNATAYGKTGSATVTVQQRAAHLTTDVTSLRFGTLSRTASLAASVEDARGNPMAGGGISWSSADATIATVDGAGLVTALRAGSTTVSATLDALRADVAVNVVPVADSVTLVPGAATLTALTDSVLFVATVLDSAGNVLAASPVTWTSSAIAVATVDAAGLVLPVADGTATVTATAGAASAGALVTVNLAGGGGGPEMLIASPDTAFVHAPWTNAPVFKARVVDGVGVGIPGRTYSWRFITYAGDYTLQAIGAVTGDSVRVDFPYYGASGRKLIKIEVTSGVLADTVLFFQVGPVKWDGLAAGRAHTCGFAGDEYGGVTSDVYCWGDNSRGQLGLPSSVADSPVPVRVPLDGVTVAQVSAGDDYTCARTFTATVYCWGSNQYGQLGYASSDDCGGIDCSRTPTVVPGVRSLHVSAGPEHACSNIQQISFMGFGTPPHIDCWGRNQYGQLGVDPTGTPFTSTPVVVAPIPATGGIDGLAAFGGTTCFVISNVRRCMGLNGSGEYGMNSTTSDFVPTTSTGVPPALYDSGILGGVGFVCGYPRLGGDTTFGKISCWGTDALGQLGLPGGHPRQMCGASPCVTDATAAPLPQPRYLGSPLNQGMGPWDVGAAHACASATSNDLVCWGDNASGQLGDGSTTGRSTPVPTGLPAGYIRQVTAGTSHTCADISGLGLYCWGNGGNGRLGDGARTTSLTPVRVRDP